MRENTRCEVDEPMSTPTDSTTTWSSSSSERPVEEKKMRPPLSSCSTGMPVTYPQNGATVARSRLQLQQRIRIAVAELRHVGRRECHLVEEIAAARVGRERIVDREHDAVDAERLQCCD